MAFSLFFDIDFFSPSDSGPAAAPRGEVKAAAGRRTSAPPAVNSQGHQQRALQREKSKENQLDRNGCHQPDSDRSGFDVGQYHAARQREHDIIVLALDPAGLNSRHLTVPRVGQRQTERETQTEGLPPH